MRDVKFRAWDGETMYNVRAIVWHAGVPATVEVFAPDEPGGTKLLYWFELMEYTGRKDIKEQEIFEDDVIVDHSTGKRYRVFMNGLTNGWWFVDEHGDYADKVNIDELEKIGNIWDNPKLMRKAG